MLLHSDQARGQMVREQMEARGIRDRRVLLAMREIPREAFVPPDQVPFAFDDRPLPIGRDQTISQPYIVALMTEALALGPDDRVLEIGAGSGYQSAVLSRLVDHVCALERDPLLADSARQALASLGIRNVDLRCGDGYDGWPEQDSEFDAILIACAAVAAPPNLLAQLAPGGRMILPIGAPDTVQQLVCLRRDRNGRLSIEDHGAVRFVPMV